MPALLKRGPSSDRDDLGMVTVIDHETPATIERYRFEVVEKHRQNVRKTKSRRAQQYGGGAEETDHGGICAGEVLKLTTRFRITEGRHVSLRPDRVPDHIVTELLSAGANGVSAE